MKKRSVTISGKNDCVVMTDEEAMVITLKFSPDIEITDMTSKHGYKTRAFASRES